MTHLDEECEIDSKTFKIQLEISLKILLECLMSIQGVPVSEPVLKLPKFTSI